MLVHKVRQSRYFSLFKTYFTWLAFIALVFTLTNLFSSLDLIKEYQSVWLDVALTFGFLFLFSALDAVLGAGVLCLFQAGLEKIFRRDLRVVVRVLLVAALVYCWVNLFLSIFNLPIFKS